MTVYTKSNFVADIFHFKSIFLSKTANWGFRPHIYESWGQRTTFVDSSLESPYIYDFPFVIIELFSLALTVETLQLG